MKQIDYSLLLDQIRLWKRIIDPKNLLGTKEEQLSKIGRYHHNWQGGIGITPQDYWTIQVISGRKEREQILFLK